MTTYTLHLPFATPSQNTWQRMHWGKQRKLKATIEAWIRLRLNELGRFGVARPRCKVRITVKRFSNGILDRGNFIGGCKPLLDALRDEGVIQDDSPVWLDDHYEQHEAKRGQQCMVIHVEAA